MLLRGSAKRMLWGNPRFVTAADRSDPPCFPVLSITSLRCVHHKSLTGARDSGELMSTQTWWKGESELYIVVGTTHTCNPQRVFRSLTFPSRSDYRYQPGLLPLHVWMRYIQLWAELQISCSSPHSVQIVWVCTGQGDKYVVQVNCICSYTTYTPS